MTKSETFDRSRGVGGIFVLLTRVIRLSAAKWAPLPLRLIVGYGFAEHGLRTRKVNWQLTLSSVIESAPLFLSGMLSDSLGLQPGTFSRRRRIESLCLLRLQTHAMGSEAHLTMRQRLH